MVTEATLKSAMKKNGYGLMDEDMFNRCVDFLSNRYAKYFSGSDCASCWVSWSRPSRCRCDKPQLYTNLEKMAYEFRPLWPLDILTKGIQKRE